jgi:hypothetical protein
MVVSNHLNGHRGMKLTPGQIQEILGLSRAAYRHWKEALPPLEGRNGHGPCFSLGDLLAMALIKTLTEDAGVKVGALSAVAAQLFEQSGRQSWAGFERTVLVLELSSVRVEFLADGHVLPSEQVSILVPCGRIVADLRERLLDDAEEAQQGTLRFSPTIVRGSAS